MNKRRSVDGKIKMLPCFSLLRKDRPLEDSKTVLRQNMTANDVNSHSRTSATTSAAMGRRSLDAPHMSSNSNGRSYIKVAKVGCAQLVQMHFLTRILLPCCSKDHLGASLAGNNCKSNTTSCKHSTSLKALQVSTACAVACVLRVSNQSRSTFLLAFLLTCCSGIHLGVAIACLLQWRVKCNFMQAFQLIDGTFGKYCVCYCQRVKHNR